MVPRKLTIVLFLFVFGVALNSTSFAQYSATKVKMGIADANTANLSSEPKSMLSRSEHLMDGEQQGLLKKDVSPEWRLGYSFQAWFIMMVQYRSLKDKLTPEEAEACNTCITSYGQKFRREQKGLGLNDDQLFEALGKPATIPDMYADFWPPSLDK